MEADEKKRKQLKRDGEAEGGENRKEHGVTGRKREIGEKSDRV